MIPDRHEMFQRMIDESLAGAISAEDERSLRDHIANCVPCTEYLSTSHRVLAGLSGFSFEVTSAHHAKVIEALALKVEQLQEAQRSRWRFLHPHSVPKKIWAAFAVALSMSFVGSALMYQTVKRLAVPMHFDTAQAQAGVLVFWLLPSLCAAVYLLAATGEERGMA